MDAKVTGPSPVSRLPTPLFAPSPVTDPIFAHFLSSARSVPAVTKVSFKNSRVSGDINLTRAPTFAYFKFDVADDPIAKGPLAVKYPVLVLVPVVVEFHVAFNVAKFFVPYLR